MQNAIIASIMNRFLPSILDVIDSQNVDISFSEGSFVLSKLVQCIIVNICVEFCKVFFDISCFPCFNQGVEVRYAIYFRIYFSSIFYIDSMENVSPQAHSHITGWYPTCCSLFWSFRDTFNGDYPWLKSFGGRKESEQFLWPYAFCRHISIVIVSL